MRFFAKSFLFVVALWFFGPADAYAQDAAAGQKTFNACRACHQIGDNSVNSIGPVLTGVVGRKAGIIADYRYSDANKNSGITWDEPTLTEYLRNPQAKVPGTKMMFPGLKKDEDIANVIAFLKTQTAH
jgi:cytochrome c